MNNSFLLLVIFESVLLFQIIYILFQWYFIRDREYFYYIAYMSTVSIYIFNQLGSEIPVFQGFWLFNYSHYLTNSLPILSFFFYYRFAKFFVDLAKNYPRLKIWVVALEYILLLYVITELCFRLFKVNKFVIDQFYIAISILLFSSTFLFIILFLRKRVVYTYFIISGAILINLGAFGTFLILIQADAQPALVQKFHPYFPYIAATILELLCFTSGLAYKARNFVLEKNVKELDYLNELNEKLELQKRLNAVRNNVAIELHEKVGSVLSNMEIQSSFAQKAMQKKENHKLESYINNLSNLARQGHEITDELIWSINPSVNKIEHLVHKIEQFCNEKLTPENISVEITCHPSVAQIKPQREDLLLFYRIIKRILMTNLHNLPNDVKLYVNASDSMIRISLNLVIPINFIQENSANLIWKTEQINHDNCISFSKKITTISD